MNHAARLGLSVFLAAALYCNLPSAGVTAQAAPAPPAPAQTRPLQVAGRDAVTDKPLVQIAILLDTSNSMDGLIDQARTQLWRIVGTFGSARRKGVAPVLEVALYEYGKSSLPGEEGYLRLVVPLTTDLDRVSEELFKLTTNGGEEYCGWVIKEAVQGLRWSHDKDALKLIFIAGNEPFTQGPKSYRDSIPVAVEKDIVVNTIFCGPYNDGVSTSWKEGADLGNGRYVSINMDHKAAHVDAPQDKEIARLNAELNKTYVPYGAHGAEGQGRQQAQDTAAGSVSPAMSAQRTAAKANAQYSNTEWDMVDAVKNNSVKVESVKDADLPAEMRSMTPAQRAAYVQQKMQQRQQIQDRIKALSKERDQYVVSQTKKQPANAPATLDSAMIETVRAEASKKSIDF